MSDDDVIDIKSPLEGLARSLDLLGGSEDQPRPIAGCPRCREPLISTFEFPKAEFYCQACGAKVGFLSPRPLTWTQELKDRHDELKMKYDVERAWRDPVVQMVYAIRWIRLMIGRLDWDAKLMVTR